MRANDFDFVYISYDEPNAEENFLDLKSKFKNVQRVHGVKGFDKAHRQAASLVKGDYLFIVDGDNQVTKDFLNEEISENELSKNKVLSWAGKNIVNGLVYGNGGVKLWPRELLSSVDCHDSGKGNDWCFEIPYQQMNNWFSYSIINSSPLQAFRSGFREGIKLCLNSRGSLINGLLDNIELIPSSNLRRLIAWMTLGQDKTNGLFSIYGARLGFLKAVCEKDLLVNIVSDFDWIAEYWREELREGTSGHISEHLIQMGQDIRKITELPIYELNSEQSMTAKSLMYNPKREGLLTTLREENAEAIGKGILEKEL